MSLEDDIPLGFDCMVYCVPSGTKIEEDGEVFVVTEKSVVNLGDRLFCTQEIFDKIKSKTAKRLS